MKTMQHVGRVAALASVLVALAFGIAFAHATLVRSEPPDGAHVTATNG
jgi:methionine-rich copper-binding protein CopC